MFCMIQFFKVSSSAVFRTFTHMAQPSITVVLECSCQPRRDPHPLALQLLAAPTYLASLTIVTALLR